MTDGSAPPHDRHQPMPEGEEQAPPGARTMAVVRWALVALMALAAVGAWVHHVRTGWVAGQATGRQYICPMHPQIVTDQKGECPICGMDLVPAGDARPAAAAQAGAARTDPAAGAEYTCPMHPAFVTTDPAARCPECGMKLVPKAPPAASAPVPGLVPVDLAADRVQLIRMKTAMAGREPLAERIRATGFVAPNEAGVVSVNTRFSGYVESLAVAQVGQLVQKGQVLITVYSPEMYNAQQTFLNAVRWTTRKSNVAPAEGLSTDLERDARQRLELLGVAPQDIDAIEAAGQPLRNINVRSPARGYVARKNVLTGLYLQPGTEIFQIADLSTVWVLVDVAENDAARVAVGQKALLQLGAYPGETFVGRVQFVYPALNTGSRTLQARLEFRNPSLKLRPGMFGDVTLEVGGAEGVTVPSEALIDTGDQQYVFVDRGGGRYEPRAVRVGWSGDGKVAILRGLAAGERVVTTANFLLDSESRLRAAVEGFGGAPAAAHDHGAGEHDGGMKMDTAPAKGAAPVKMDMPPAKGAAPVRMDTPAGTGAGPAKKDMPMPSGGGAMKMDPPAGQSGMPAAEATPVAAPAPPGPGGTVAVPAGPGPVDEGAGTPAPAR
jgi:Cu(I)/Ag(I) efflux system membrane fusion protein